MTVGERMFRGKKTRRNRDSFEQNKRKKILCEWEVQPATSTLSVCRCSGCIVFFVPPLVK